MDISGFSLSLLLQSRALPSPHDSRCIPVELDEMYPQDDTESPSHDMFELPGELGVLGALQRTSGLRSSRGESPLQGSSILGRALSWCGDWSGNRHDTRRRPGTAPPKDPIL